MPLQATSGAASYDGFGGGVAVVPTYIEDVFSTWLYTGTGAAQTITNGIDLSTKGGLVWTKSRSAAGEHNFVCNDVGVGKWLVSNTLQIAQSFAPNGYAVPVFNTTGVTLSDSADQATNAVTYTSWSLRKQPKFFDVVTYTGNATARTIAHSLGSVPGCIIVKSTTSVSNWYVYHRSLATNQALKLNSTAAIETATTLWNNTAATSTEFSVGTAGDTNGNGQTFVAYLFAHDAGGFGLTGTDNVISCGSFTYVSGTLSVNLGYEPQWVMIKQTNGSGSWFINDNMRNWRIDNGSSAGTGTLYAQSSNAEGTGGADWNITSTGFNVTSGTGTFIYIAIRRGPMKVPTLGTSVFSPITSSASTGTVLTTSFPVDLQIVANRTATDNKYFMDRLRGVSTPGAAISTPILYSNLRDAEVTNSTATRSFDNTSFQMPGLFNGYSTIFYNFGRAPGFFDEVCYTGTGVAGQTFTHNLGVVPELMIVKGRSIAEEWSVYFGVNTNYLKLNASAVSEPATTRWNDTSPTSSVFSLGTSNWVNGSGSTYVNYLFATCAGVSKVGSYTGTGTTKQINCGFTGGARFVLIKRTDAVGDWYVWDSARGIVAGNDPYLLLNSTAAEVTSTDYVDTYSAGFEISSTAPAAINASGGSYIFLAIA